MLRKTLLCCLLALGTLAWSQNVKTEFEIFGAYTYTPSNFAFLGSGESGWDAGMAVDANPWLGLKADVAQYYSSYPNEPGDHSKTITFLFGPQVSLPLRSGTKLRPFGQFLIGGAHINYTTSGFNNAFFQQSTSFAWDFGGGLDIRLTRHFWLRGEGDYLHNHFVTFDNQLQSEVPDSHARLVMGLVFRF